MKARFGLTLAASAAVVVSCAGAALAAAGGAGTSPPASGGAAAARTVNVRALAAGRQMPAHEWNGGPLGRDGRPADGALHARRRHGVKHAPAPAGPVTGGPNSGSAPAGGQRAVNVPAAPQPEPQTPPSTVNANFSGISQANSDCGGCQPPDTNAAVGRAQIVEAVNLRLEVYSKNGVAQCGIGLNTFLGTSAGLSDPRVQYDNLNNRFSMVVTVVPGAGATPSLYVMASQTADACGSWWIYHMTFHGSFYPNGTLLDYPYLGQDRVSVLISSNNFCCAPSHSYLDSAAFSISKALLYTGAAVSFTSYGVSFSTAPVTVSGIPVTSTSTTYLLAAVPGSGYDLFRMTTGPNDPITLQAHIRSPFTAPTRRVRQPGTSVTLDPLDGRIPWAPVQSQNFVWFAHGIDLAGYPSVRYGAIGVLTNTPFVAIAYHSATSDDFNPSIGVADAGSNVVRAWVNWAYTDSARSVATSDTINGVLPGGGVPSLIGTDHTLVSGSPTASNRRFGDFSSVEVDPVAASGTCPAGRTAVTNQEYFTGDGRWATRLARTSFC